MNKRLLVGGIVITLVIVLGFFLIKGDSISPIKVTEYSDENSTVKIITNSITNEATIEMDFLIEDEILHPEFFGQQGDTTEFTTTMFCGLMTMAFFDEEALDELGKQINTWNEMEGVVKDEENKEMGEPEGNPLEGYDVIKVTVIITNKDNLEKASQCTITGAEEEDIQITYY